MSSMDEDVPVVIPYSLLVEPDNTLSPLVRRAFSSDPSSLGLLIISDLPSSLKLAEKRERAFRLGNAFAQLPEATREQYSDASSRYSYGWSQGKEIHNGVADHRKGSFYADLTPEGGEESPCNRWPTNEESVEGFETAFKELTAVMTHVGTLVARACEPIVRQGDGIASAKSVEELVGQSRANKARLLHYFPRSDSPFSLPPSASLPAKESAETIDDSWCGTHVDHSLLTVLCPAMYLFHPTSTEAKKLDPLAIPAPSTSTGLYIKTRAGRTVKAPIPEGCLALQTGETLELLSSDRLAATPHFVNSTAASLGRKALEAIKRKKEESEDWRDVESGVVSRETMAVFMQPNNDEVVSRETGETFGEFTQRVLGRHYEQEL